MYRLCNEITIGSFKFSGVHALTVSKSIHSLVEEATLELPAQVTIANKPQNNIQKAYTADKFLPGDAVEIMVGYNDELKQEFVGFIKSIQSGNTVKLVCEGYSYVLKNSSPKVPASGQLSDLLKASVVNDKGSISIVSTVDAAIKNMRSDKLSGFEIIEQIRDATDKNLQVFFVEPGKLWCGLPHSEFATTGKGITRREVSLRIGFNCLSENTIMKNDASANPSTIVYQHKSLSGDLLSYQSDISPTNKSVEKKLLTNIDPSVFSKNLANEKALVNNYSSYSGNITAFLQPYVQPGDVVNLINKYEPVSGRYLVGGTSLKFGVNGGRREINLIRKA